MFKQILLVFAALAFGSSSAIAASHFHIVANPSPNSEASASPDTALAPNLHPIIADFGAPSPSGDWPCYAGSSNCADIASGGLVIGAPTFTWSLANCDAKAKKDTTPCGQIYWFYEDDTNDNTDHLVLSVVVTQGKNYILDISEDQGPNPYGASVVYAFGDFSFGTLGNHTGPGNGYCYVNTVTCANPHAGIANVVITTTVGIYSLTQRFQINLQ
jgi:hypothetical protein